MRNNKVAFGTRPPADEDWNVTRHRGRSTDLANVCTLKPKDHEANTP